MLQWPLCQGAICHSGSREQLWPVNKTWSQSQRIPSFLLPRERVGMDASVDWPAHSYGDEPSPWASSSHPRLMQPGGQVSTSGRRADAEGGAARRQRSARSGRCNPSQTWVQPATSKVTGVMGARSGEGTEAQAQAHTASLGSTGTTVGRELWECRVLPGRTSSPRAGCWQHWPAPSARASIPSDAVWAASCSASQGPVSPRVDGPWWFGRESGTDRPRRPEGDGERREENEKRRWGREEKRKQSKKDKRRLSMVRNLGNWRGRQN